MRKVLQKMWFVNGLLQILLGILEVIDFMMDDDKKENCLKLLVGAGFMAAGILNCKEAAKKNNAESPGIAEAN